jgi:hypothetical protein
MRVPGGQRHDGWPWGTAAGYQERRRLGLADSSAQAVCGGSGLFPPQVWMQVDFFEIRFPFASVTSIEALFYFL